MKYDLSVIIPFLNERENLEKLAPALNNYFSNFQRVRTEVIFVDDGSTDGSCDVLEKISYKSYSAKLIKLSKNFGSHAALRAGILHSSADIVTFVYADLQDPLELIAKLYEKLCEGNDIVWGNRNTAQVGFSEHFFSKLYAFLIRKFAFPGFFENNFDIVMFNKKVKDELNRNIEANSSIFLQIFSLGFRQALITYDKKARAIGKSKWTLSKKIKLFIDSFVAFSYAPIRFVSIVGILLSLVGFIWAIYVVVRTIFVRDLEPGWPALLSILMIGFGITNISLGVIAEYVWRTLDASRNRKVFIVDEVIEIGRNNGSKQN